ncbi:MAG: hypothetical protein D3918_09190, partial [Candidatus Electrothrix sp. AX2]|nr:hypothetical protein [Candidatus Electrothrix gigas]
VGCVGLGSIVYNMGFYQPALQWYNKCLNLQDDHEMCLRNRLLTYLQLGQPEKSFNDAEKLTRLYPKKNEYQYRKLASSYYSDNLKIAMKALQQIADLSTNQHNAMYLVGMLMMREKAYPNSLFYLKQANRISPNRASYQLALAAAYYANNQVLSAEKTIHELVNSHSLPAIEKSLKKEQQYLHNSTINFIEKTIRSLFSSNQLHLKNAKKTN